MNAGIVMAITVLASGAVQFGILVGTGVTQPLPLAAGVIGAVGSAALALLKQLPRKEWSDEERTNRNS